MIIIGSTALQYHGFDVEPKDLDVNYRESEELSGNKEDAHVIPDDLYYMIPHNEGYATPDAIYTLKCSHLPWDIKWEKTKRHVLWLKHMGCKLIPEMYYAFKKYWEEIHGDKSFLSLGQEKGEFFNDHVVYKYDHDYLHELVAYPKEPAYKQCLKDGHDVLTDEVKFNQMDRPEQIRMFREEITVIAFERWLAHDSCDVSWFKAYLMSLKKTITNLTKNWASDFLVLNLEEFVKPDYSYFKYMIETLKEKQL